MQLSVNGKQLDIGSSLKEHIERQVPVIVEKYFVDPTDASVTISKEGSSFRTDVAVHVGKGIMVQGHALSGDAYGSFDAALEHVGKRLRRYKRRLRDHHRRQGGKTERFPAAQYVLAPEQEEVAETDVGDAGDVTENGDQPVIIAEMQTDIETLTVSDAVMRMDLANLPAMMFRNRANGALNMVYVRRDGNIGWIDPQENKS